MYTPCRCYIVEHDDVIKWKHFRRYWTFVRGMHRSPVNSPHKVQWRGALIVSLICALNKRLSKQSWGRWFGAPSRSSWRHHNDLNIDVTIISEYVLCAVRMLRLWTLAKYSCIATDPLCVVWRRALTTCLLCGAPLYKVDLYQWSWSENIMESYSLTISLHSCMCIYTRGPKTVIPLFIILYFERNRPRAIQILVDTERQLIIDLITECISVQRIALRLNCSVRTVKMVPNWHW